MVWSLNVVLVSNPTEESRADQPAGNDDTFLGSASTSTAQQLRHLGRDTKKSGDTDHERTIAACLAGCASALNGPRCHEKTFLRVAAHSSQNPRMDFHEPRDRPHTYKQKGHVEE